MPAQVGKDELIARRQGLGRGQPEFMMGGKGMEEHQRRSRPQDMVCNLSVATRDVHHRTAWVGGSCVGRTLLSDAFDFEASKSIRRTNI